MSSPPAAMSSTINLLPDDAKLAIQLHCTEYQSLMTRINQQTTLQYGLWGALVAYVGFAVNLWSKVPQLSYPKLVSVWLLWGSVLIAEVVTLFWFILENEMMKTIDYLRHRLTSMVANCLPQDTEFWSANTFDGQIRERAFLGKIPPLIVPLVALVLVVPELYRDYHWYHLLGLAVNLIVLLFVAVKAIETFDTAKKARENKRATAGG